MLDIDALPLRVKNLVTTLFPKLERLNSGDRAARRDLERGIRNAGREGDVVVEALVVRFFVQYEAPPLNWPEQQAIIQKVLNDRNPFSDAHDDGEDFDFSVEPPEPAHEEAGAEADAPLSNQPVGEPQPLATTGLALSSGYVAKATLLETLIDGADLATCQQALKVAMLSDKKVLTQTVLDTMAAKATPEHQRVAIRAVVERLYGVFPEEQVSLALLDFLSDEAEDASVEPMEPPAPAEEPESTEPSEILPPPEEEAAAPSQDPGSPEPELV